MNNAELAQLHVAAREQVNNEVLPALLAAFPEKVEQVPTTNDLIPQVWLAPDVLRSVAEWLKARGFNMLVDIGGVDYYPKRDPRFEVVYQFRQVPAMGMIRLRVRCTEKDPVPTVSDIWKMASCAEREVYDQFGIAFKGHPDLKRVLNPQDWVGHPLRKDYPLRGPRALINLEMPADENRYHAFVDVEPSNSQEGK